MLRLHVDRVRRRFVSRALCCVAALVAATAMAAPSSALASYPAVQTDCPTGDASGTQIDHWNKIYPGIGQPDRGVTLCVGMGGPLANEPYAYLQIVRPGAGAKMRIVSTVAPQNVQPPGVPSPWGGPAETLFEKRTAEDWFTGMATYNEAPDASNLFSTANAGFFISTTDPLTKLSLPEAQMDGVTWDNPWWPKQPSGTLDSTGWAIATKDAPAPDFAWNADKKYLKLNALGGLDPLDGLDPEVTQNVTIGDFPQHYNEYQDIPTAFLGPYDPFHPDNWWYPQMPDGLVGFTAEQPGADEFARRTMVGITDGDGWNAVNILSTAHSYSIGEMGTMLDDLGVDSNQRIQLDGGHSAQMFNKLGGVYSLQGTPAPLTERPVPQVLAVFEAPEAP